LRHEIRPALPPEKLIFLPVPVRSRAAGKRVPWRCQESVLHAFGHGGKVNQFMKTHLKSKT
jgi:hypothetical protein